MSVQKGGFEVAEKCFKFFEVFTADDCIEMVRMSKNEAVAHASKLWKEAGRELQNLKTMLSRRSR